MKNFIQEGDSITLTAPYTVVAGAAALVGGIFGVAVDDTTSGAAGVFMREGVFDLACLSTDTPALGDPMYWDNTNKYVTTSSSGNTHIGFYASPITKLTGVATARVVLNQMTGATKVRAGTIALDGSNPTPITTGLTTVTGCSLTLQGTAAPGDNTSVLTYDISSGTINAYAWKNTSGSDPTLVASTGTETISWVAVGT